MNIFRASPIFRIARAKLCLDSNSRDAVLRNVLFERTTILRPSLSQYARHVTLGPIVARSALRQGKGSESSTSSRRFYHTSQTAKRWTSAIGAEPGLDPDADDPKLARLVPESHADVQIIDYSKDRLEHHKLESSSLESFLKDQPKPEWAACRWIYVNGLSWDVVKSLGSSKDLHPLAIEDVLDTRTPTKVNWYEGHCFLEMNLVKLVQLQQDQKHARNEDPAESLLDTRFSDHQRPKQRILSPHKYAMSWEQVSCFMTSDKTIITFFERSGNDVLEPVLARLQSSQTVVRSSNDPSMLLQAVIDTVVDLSLPIGTAAAEIFDELEYSVLSNPTISQSKQLHILRSGLTLLMNNTVAIGGLVRTLCDHRAVTQSNGLTSGDTPNLPAPVTSVQISPLAQVYFQDVQDHISALSTSTNMSIRAAENLSSLIFNTIAASQNESVRKLTLVSSFFLPLTFLTGYFGMNFDPMPIVQDHSDIVFWVIATPVMLTTLLVLGIRARWSRRSAVSRRQLPTAEQAWGQQELRRRRMDRS